MIKLAAHTTKRRGATRPDRKRDRVTIHLSREAFLTLKIQCDVERISRSAMLTRLIEGHVSMVRLMPEAATEAS